MKLIIINGPNLNLLGIREKKYMEVLHLNHILKF